MYFPAIFLPIIFLSQTILAMLFPRENDFPDFFLVLFVLTLNLAHSRKPEFPWQRVKQLKKIG